jgi:hypothetical protein
LCVYLRNRSTRQDKVILAASKKIYQDKGKKQNKTYEKEVKQNGREACTESNVHKQKLNAKTKNNKQKKPSQEKIGTMPQTKAAMVVERVVREHRRGENKPSR